MGRRVPPTFREERWAVERAERSAIVDEMKTPK